MYICCTTFRNDFKASAGRSSHYILAETLYPQMLQRYAFRLRDLLGAFSWLGYLLAPLF